MTDTGAVRVDGARELRRTLKAAGDDLADLTSAHGDAARTVVAGTRAPARTGALQASVRGSGTKTASIVRAGRASVPYAHVIHWGYPRRNIRAQPFLTTAAAQTEPAWLPVFVDAVQRILDKVKGA